jgi:dihydropteroate synthase
MPEIVGPSDGRASDRGNPRTLDTFHGQLAFGGRCLVMGILNVTPDSFSDGGHYVETGPAVDRSLEMAAEGADLIDIGGESTRPGSDQIAPDEQIRRIVPVIREARSRGLAVPISVDTRIAAVAAAALDAGADMVNDISGVRDDPAMPALLARRRVPFVVMHMQGTPQTMQQAPKYESVVAEVAAFFVARAEALAAAGVDVNRMIVDPGLGFGKTLEHNLALLRSIRQFGIRWPVLVGPSRKRFLGDILNEPDPVKRIMGTAAAVAHCALSGVDIVRVHDVREMRQIVEVCSRLHKASRE